jgi:cytochrome c-type biogenesis protein CcmH
MKRRLFRSAGIVILLLVLMQIGAFSASGQGSGPTDDEVNAIASQLYCPVCENVPLDVCPTQACVQWRATIREKLAAGWSEDEIKQYFVEQYGARVLATPPAQGLNWLVYVLPPAALLAGALVLFRAMRTWQAEPAPTAGSVTAEEAKEDDPYLARLEEELKRRET